MRHKVLVEDFVHDLAYDFLVLMKDESIWGDSEYDKGFVDSLFETYKMLQEKIALFGLEDLPVVRKMPLAEDWHREGPKIIDIDDIGR